jgi:hypothetical protein
VVWGQLNFICKNVFLCVNSQIAKKWKLFTINYITRYSQTVVLKDLATSQNGKIKQLEAKLVVVGGIIMVIRLIMTNPLGNDQPNDYATAEGRYGE